MSASEVVALVTARGGSKGLPGKNLRLLGGRPLIAWSIEAARASRSVGRVIVSTDDPAIASAARAAGAEAPFLRPADISGDDSPHILASEHAARWLEEQEGFRPEFFLLLQPTSPFRTGADIDAAVGLAREKNAVAVVSVCEAKPHPGKTFGLAADGTLTPFLADGPAYRRRQDLPAALAENGAIYLNRREALLRDRNFIPPGAVPYLMPAERSLDIDSAWDFELAELMVRARQEKKK